MGCNKKLNIKVYEGAWQAINIMFSYLYLTLIFLEGLSKNEEWEVRFSVSEAKKGEATMRWFVNGMKLLKRITQKA